MKKAFTLTELLATIAIVALLSSFLIPTIGKLRKSAEQTRSIQNLRQLTTARIMQTTDSEGRVPLAGWRRDILPYIGKEKSSQLLTQWQDPRCLPLFQCRIWLQLYNLKPSNPVCSFSMNGYPWTKGFSEEQINASGGGASGMPLAVMRIPPRTIMLFHGYPDPGLAKSAQEGGFYPSATPVLSGQIITANADGPPFGKLLVSRYDGSVDIYEKGSSFNLAPESVKTEWIPYSQP